MHNLTTPSPDASLTVLPGFVYFGTLRNSEESLDGHLRFHIVQKYELTSITQSVESEKAVQQLQQFQRKWFSIHQLINNLTVT